MYLSIGSAVLNIGLNFILIPYWGINGAAIATLICYFLMTLGSFFINNMMLKIDYDMIKVVLIIFICSITVVLQHTVNVSNLWFSLLINCSWTSMGLFLLYLLNFSLINDLAKKIKGLILCL